MASLGSEGGLPATGLPAELAHRLLARALPSAVQSVGGSVANGVVMKRKPLALLCAVSACLPTPCFIAAIGAPVARTLMPCGSFVVATALPFGHEFNNVGDSI
jgi:hypothetical protein